eukprot:517231_1
MLSKENDMIPCDIPDELKDLTMLEELLIAKACPILRAYIKSGAYRGYSGHVINVPQDISEFATRLPRKVSDVPMIYISKENQYGEKKDFLVNRDRVHNALLWLKANNP